MARNGSPANGGAQQQPHSPKPDTKRETKTSTDLSGATFNGPTIVGDNGTIIGSITNYNQK